MNFIKHGRLISAIFYTVLVATVMVSPALADKGGAKNKPALYEIEEKDRLVLQGYLTDWNRSNCPPGLAKKRVACMPPGQAKKYEVGDVLPEKVTYQSLPTRILKQLKPVPADHRYVRVDQDVFLIATATRRIVDAVALLSAAN